MADRWRERSTRGEHCVHSSPGRGVSSCLCLAGSVPQGRFERHGPPFQNRVFVFMMLRVVFLKQQDSCFSSLPCKQTQSLSRQGRYAHPSTPPYWPPLTPTALAQRVSGLYGWKFLSRSRNPPTPSRKLRPESLESYDV